VGTNYLLALADLADELAGTLARLFAYVGTLALLAIVGLAALEQLPRLGDTQAAFGSIWAAADPCDPASIASQVNFQTRSARYAVSRRPAGEPDADAGPKRRVCAPDWLREAEIVQLRGSL
jgi:hypothetical protein